MEKDNVIELVQPGEFKDQLTEVLRQGAQALVLQAVEAARNVYFIGCGTSYHACVAGSVYFVRLA